MSMQSEKFDPIGKHEAASLGARTAGDSMQKIGLPVEIALPSDELPTNLTKGWIIDFSDADLIHTFNAEAYTLRPNKWVNSPGDAFNARMQLHKWRKELGGEVVHLLVPDSSQGEKPWIAAPVLRDWLMNMRAESLFALYDHAKADDPKKLQYRAAFIVVAGCKPEEYIHS